ncbi:hypothetical protein PHBOTO_005293 [Pseudozyma hubeiensis]|nr:hypothetical protein PHBOTO_005293 [Pseudozyma hubeiensis]
MAAIDTEHESLPAKPERSSSNVSQAANPPSKLAAMVEKPIFPLLRLPPEIVLRILYWLYMETVYMSHNSGERQRQHFAYWLKNPRLANWFKFKLPCVNALFHQLLTPVLLPCVGIASRRLQIYQKTPLHDLVSFPALLAQLRHLSVDFDRLIDSRFAENERLYLGHVCLIIAMSSCQLVTLELNDLVLSSCEGDSTDIGRWVPYGANKKAKPWQFDLTCTNLVQALADIEEERHLIPRFKQVIQEQRVGFPHLKSALLMDGNGGISVEDYANLLLIPRELCNFQVSDTQCSKTSTKCNNLTTACPALEDLTLVLWYDQLHIDRAFIDAMAHIKRHHKDLFQLTLVSRRLRYEPRLSGAGVSLSQWFERDVVPVLRHVFMAFAEHSMLVNINILTLDEDEVYRAIETLWKPVESRLRQLYNPRTYLLFVKPLRVRQYSQKEVFGAVAQEHRQMSISSAARQKPCPTRPATWIDPSSVQQFFRKTFNDDD